MVDNSLLLCRSSDFYPNSTGETLILLSPSDFDNTTEQYSCAGRFFRGGFNKIGRLKISLVGFNYSKASTERLVRILTARAMVRGPWIMLSSLQPLLSLSRLSALYPFSFPIPSLTIHLPPCLSSSSKCVFISYNIPQYLNLRIKDTSIYRMPIYRCCVSANR